MQSKLLVFIIVLALVFLIKGTFGIYNKFKESVSRREVAEEQLASLKERGTTLTEDINRLSTEKGVEEEIRKKFNMAKDGEEVAIIVEDKNSSKESGVVEIGFWKRIAKFLHIAK